MTTKSKSSRAAKANGQAHRASRLLSDTARLKEFDKLGPFEIKDFVQNVPSKTALENSLSYLNAGRGNPSWVATEPREAFFLLGQFAITESKRVLDLPPGVGGMPGASGIADRLEAWLKKHADMPGAPFLQAMVPWAVKKFSFDPDKFVHELVDSIIGDHYPVPDRMLVHNEQIVHEYLEWAMCGNPRPEGKFKIYAVEGGTAAMCYIFKSLKSNRILNPGDTIALGVPIFTPYLEMAHLEDYDLHYVEIHAKQEERFQYPDEEIKKLLDPKLKELFIVNPGNPRAVASAAGHDDTVLAQRADGGKEGLSESLHRHLQEASRGNDRRTGHRSRSESVLRLLLRPDRFRVFCPQIPGRGRRQVDKGKRAPARHRVPVGRGPRHRPAQRRGLCRSRLVGARVLRKPGESRLRRHRSGGTRHRARVQAGL